MKATMELIQERGPATVSTLATCHSQRLCTCTRSEARECEAFFCSRPAPPFDRPCSVFTLLVLCPFVASSGHFPRGPRDLHVTRGRATSPALGCEPDLQQLGVWSFFFSCSASSFVSLPVSNPRPRPPCLGPAQPQPARALLPTPVLRAASITADARLSL